jgi:hypothetical protein
MQAPRPPSDYAGAVRRGLKKPPDRSAGVSAFRGPGSAQQQDNPYAVPRTYGDKSVRVYTRGTSLPVSTVKKALRDQLGVEVGRAQGYGSSYVDVVMTGADDKKKVEHRSIQIGEEVYYIGPTFPYEKKVVTVILSRVDDGSAGRVTEAFRAALGKGATFLAATHGSSLQRKRPDYCERVYLEMDPGVRMCDVVPRVLQVDGKHTCVYWYNAGPFCRRCGKGNHPASRCKAALWRPRGRGPARPAKEGNGRSPPTPPASAKATASASAPNNNNQTNSADQGTPANTEREPATEAYPAVAVMAPREQPGDEAGDRASDVSVEALAGPVNTQAEPVDEERPAAAETAQRGQPGAEASDGALDVSVEALARPVNTQAEPVDEEALAGPVNTQAEPVAEAHPAGREPVAEVRPAAAETAQRGQPGDEASADAVDTGKEASALVANPQVGLGHTAARATEMTRQRKVAAARTQPSKPSLQRTPMILRSSTKKSQLVAQQTLCASATPAPPGTATKTAPEVRRGAGSGAPSAAVLAKRPWPPPSHP